MHRGMRCGTSLYRPSLPLALPQIHAGALGTPPPTSFFGVSPPVRSGWAGGAANPIGHDTTWSRNAIGCSRTNLQVRGPSE